MILGTRVLGFLGITSIKLPSTIIPINLMSNSHVSTVKIVVILSIYHHLMHRSKVDLGDAEGTLNDDPCGCLRR